MASSCQLQLFRDQITIAERERHKTRLQHNKLNSFLILEAITSQIKELVNVAEREVAFVFFLKESNIILSTVWLFFEIIFKHTV